MSTMRLKQVQHPEKKHGKQENAEDCIAPMDYPSTRYFQIHFQFLHEQIENLKEQLQEANSHIAAQNEILQKILEKP